MKPFRPPNSPHAVSRLTAWIRLKLVFFAAVTFFQLMGDRRAHKRWLNHVSLAVAKLVFIHASQRIVRPRHRGKRRPGQTRALIGSELRRALRRRDPAEHFFAILTVMRDLEAHVARLAKRLAYGLTRRNAKPPRREHHRIALPLRAFVCAGADTS